MLGVSQLTASPAPCDSDHVLFAMMNSAIHKYGSFQTQGLIEGILAHMKSQERHEGNTSQESLWQEGERRRRRRRRMWWASWGKIRDSPRGPWRLQSLAPKSPVRTKTTCTPARQATGGNAERTLGVNPAPSTPALEAGLSGWSCFSSVEC